MGGALCWRRQKGALQWALCVLVLGTACGVLLLLRRLQDTAHSLDTQATQHRLQQEALSAQLQVVYEHRSRLERSLQKERAEHKKTKEDFLVYKLEAQETLNKEKQDAMNRYSALSSQHTIVKTQLSEVRSQLQAEQAEQGEQRLAQRRALEECRQREALLRTESQDHISTLQDTVVKLREESKLLRKAHQDVHTQLLSAQAQLTEFKQLRQALQKVPGLKLPGGNLPQAHGGEPLGPQLGQVQAVNQKVSIELSLPSLTPAIAQAKVSATPPYSPGNAVIGHPNPLWAGPGENQNSVVQRGAVRLTRTVNTVTHQSETKLLQVQVPPDRLVVEQSSNQKDQLVDSMAKQAGSERLAHGWHVDSRNSITRKANSYQRQDQDSQGASQEPAPDHLQKDAVNDLKGAGPVITNENRPGGEGHDEGELEIDGALGEEKEEELQQGQGIIAQEPMMPDAEDPNNLGEDELEEAGLEHPHPEGEEQVPTGHPPNMESELSIRQGLLPRGPPQVAVAIDNHQETPEDYQEDLDTDNEEGPQLGNAEDQETLPEEEEEDEEEEGNEEEY
ncbi:GOLI4 protein, partial [Amia calva]|nr:GOLI4 protein [Amia calva]